MRRGVANEENEHKELDNINKDEVAGNGLGESLILFPQWRIPNSLVYY